MYTFLNFTVFEGENKASLFSEPHAKLCLLELPKRNNKNPTLNGGEECKLFRSPKLPHSRIISQQFCRQL